MSSPPSPTPGDMSAEEFFLLGYQIVDWIADYRKHPERYAISPNVDPGSLISSLPPTGPDAGEP